MFFLGRRNKNPMKTAIQLAKKAMRHDDVPIGAVVARRGDRGDWEVVGRGENRVQSKNNPMAHAEIVAIHEATRNQKSKFLDDCVIFTTLEPCAMCATAISFARIKTVILAARDIKGGGIFTNSRVYDTDSHLFRPEVIEDLECAAEAGQLLTDFFKKKRQDKAKKRLENMMKTCKAQQN